MVTDLDPTGAKCSAEYVLFLRRRREAAGLTYRQLARRARQTHESLPPSTVATMLHRSTLPSRDLVAAYIRACGGDDGEVAAWLAARSRIAMAAVTPPAPALVDRPGTAGGGSMGIMDGRSIRLAAAGDGPRLLALRRRLDTQSAFMPLEPHERDGTPDPLPAAGPGFHLIADPGGDEPFAGYVHVEVAAHRLARRTGYLLMGVDAAWSGRGMGTRLARAALDEARRRGLRRVELTAMTHNHAAIRLYLACGFQMEGLRRSCLVVDGSEVDEYYLGCLL